jgi:hypothetical protein
MTLGFKRELEESGYIHRLLVPDKSRSVEARMGAKRVLQAREISVPIQLEIPLYKQFDGQMPPYWGYDNTRHTLDIGGADWRGYNRLRCKMRPACGGLHWAVCTIFMKNDGEIKVPDAYDREGAHWVNLDNNADNEVYWEFPDLPRDCVTELAFEITAFGGERGCEETMRCEISDIFLEEVEHAEVAHGWEAQDICYSTSGYFSGGRMQAIVPVQFGNTFELLSECGRDVLFAGDVVDKVADFSGFSAPPLRGMYKLRAGSATTQPFPICDNPFDEAVWKAINAVFAQRCGFPVAGGHGSCHADFTATHDGKTIVTNGGWHDAGDLSQQTLQTAEVVHVLLENAANCTDTILCARLLEEAVWGLDFVLKTRFGDGYRATGIGCCRYTDGILGNFDDLAHRVHNRSFDNWLMGGVQAFAAVALRGYDENKAFLALKAGKEDYNFALARFNAVGIEEGEMMEHSFNAHEAQYFAAAAYCAARLFIATGDDYYINEAARWGDLLLECQDTGQTGTGFDGFFYRCRAKKAITHFNHQAREHIFPQALAALHEIMPHESKWHAALSRHGAYLKAIFAHAQPYGMIPAGLHAYAEADDAETFYYLHVRTDYKKHAPDYRAQLLSGKQIDEKYCLRQFPIWFSFRGNSAVVLSMGTAAAIIGRATREEELKNIARDQLYWHAGKNPFAQSLMYGEGSNYAMQYALLLGETVGEMPVGIQTRDNEDAPYWPMGNNATYREVWLTVTAQWLRLVAEIM